MSPGGFDSVAAGLGGVTDGCSELDGGVLLLGAVAGVEAGVLAGVLAEPEGGAVAVPPPLLHPVTIRATTLTATPAGRQCFICTLPVRTSDASDARKHQVSGLPAAG
ncbi:hypothetical protein GCM10022235_64250 [Kribbella ginsengisoli]|uniref:Uncharacterized protein n=1 Tax=Kribbella ginsengisoli TaxID=363865 RepID=A0ABP6YJZ3_9ACTN